MFGVNSKTKRHSHVSNGSFAEKQKAIMKYAQSFLLHFGIWCIQYRRGRVVYVL